MNLIGRISFYIISHQQKIEDPIIEAPVNLLLGVVLSYYHPEYVAALIQEMPENVREDAKKSVNLLVENVPVLMEQ